MFAPLCLLNSSTRVKAKGWTIARARACARQGAGELPPPTASALRPPSTSAALSSQSHPGRKGEQVFSFKHEGVRSSCSSSSHRRCEDAAGRSAASSRAPASARRKAGVRYNVRSGCRARSFDDGCTFDSDGTCRDGLNFSPSGVWEPSGGENTSTPLVATVPPSSSSYPRSAPKATATLSTTAPPPQPNQREVALRVTNQAYNNNRTQPPTCKRRLPGASSPTRTFATATAALACVRGVGGRLGSPLGSAHPALEKRLGSSHPAPASVSSAAKKVRLADTAGNSSAPGSRFFPPSMSVSAVGCGRGSPVVYEMVQDAADDEEDAVRRSSGTWPRDGDEQEGGRREMGWNGFTLYRYGSTDWTFVKLGDVILPCPIEGRYDSGSWWL